jgi:hypothetical protein
VKPKLAVPRSDAGQAADLFSFWFALQEGLKTGMVAFSYFSQTVLKECATMIPRLIEGNRLCKRLQTARSECMLFNKPVFDSKRTCLKTHVVLFVQSA